jgi:3-hydroxybutyryl-CoA dehydrogenase
VIQKIAVIGAGTMGHGIAESFALHGYEVNLYDSAADRLAAALGEIERELRLMAEENYIPEEAISSTLDRIRTVTDLEEAVRDRDYCIEAIPEHLELKQELFQRLDSVCPAHTIFASNTSSLELSRMSERVSEARKKRMMINHWFNPAHLIPLVELSDFGGTAPEVYEEVETLYKSIGKQPVRVLKDIPGLIGTRLQQCLAREVYALIEMGAVDADNIDIALKFGPAFRHATTGLIEVSDMGGLDIWCTVADNLFGELDRSDRAPDIIRSKVKEGKLGIKSGEGFYPYGAGKAEKVRERFARRLIRQLKASEAYAGSLRHDG